MLERARKARESLAKADTSVVRDQTELARIHGLIARIHAGAGRLSDARTSYESAVAVVSGLARPHPGDREFQSQLAGACNDCVEFHCAAGKPAEALPWSNRAVTIRREMAKGDSLWPAVLSGELRSYGIVVQKCARPAEAVTAFREAIAILKSLACATTRGHLRPRL